MEGVRAASANRWVYCHPATSVTAWRRWFANPRPCRGIEGKIAAVRYARERGIPFFGLCLGMQVATIEFARNVVGWLGANSSEFDASAEQKVIDIMDEQTGITDKGGTMRLGSYKCQLKEGSLAARAYGKSEVHERHRHRYEFNNKYAAQLQSRGLVLAGKCVGRELVEIIELPDHPWFLAVQFHPELKSRPHDPHPLFVDFIRASLERRRARVGNDAFDAKAERAERAEAAKERGVRTGAGASE
jgi:CTP synthase